MFGPAQHALQEIHQSKYVGFSLLALSSIFFLVDPLASIGSFLAITAGADPANPPRKAAQPSQP